ncbi:hypothetical protein HK098_000138 [Nowakowskiella sp. JEL0407]|nr:hypothetical protein HK098_000138 [Nowakowskiella sp. JEL0407]
MVGKLEIREELQQILSSGDFSEFILSLRSPFFKNLFTLPQSLTTDPITLPYTSTALHQILEFIYMDKIPSTELCKQTDFETLFEFYLAADYLELPYGDVLSKNMLNAFSRIYGKIKVEEKFRKYSATPWTKTSDSSTPTQPTNPVNFETVSTVKSLIKIQNSVLKYSTHPTVSTNQYLSQLITECDKLFLRRYIFRGLQSKNPSDELSLDVLKITKECMLRMLLLPLTAFTDGITAKPNPALKMQGGGVVKKPSLDSGSRRQSAVGTISMSTYGYVPPTRRSRESISGSGKSETEQDEIKAVEIPRAYEKLFLFFVEWLKCHTGFIEKPNRDRDSDIPVRTPEDPDEITDTEKRRVFEEVVMFAYKNLDFEEMRNEFVRDHVDCGVFLETQMLRVYRAVRSF